MRRSQNRAGGDNFESLRFGAPVRIKLRNLDLNLLCLVAYAGGQSRIALPKSSNVDLLCDAEVVVDLNSKVSHRTLDLRVSKQKLHRAQVARAAIDQGRLRAPERVRAEHMRVQPDACNPVRNKARVLPRGHALSRPPVARKQKFVTFLPGQLQIGINGFAGVVGQFEPDGTSSLFSDAPSHGRPHAHWEQRLRP